MFNMIVKYNAWADGRDTIPTGRVFEYTENHLVAQFKPSGQLDLSALVALPTLFVQESSGQGNEMYPNLKTSGYGASLTNHR